MINCALKIVVLGGSGFVGSEVCRKLAQAKHNITVLTRQVKSAQHLQDLPGMHIVACDVFDTQALTDAIKGHDVVINLIAVLHGNEATFERIHVALPATIAKACVANGIHRLLHVSALGAAIDGPSMYQRSKARGEAVLQQAGLQLTVFRPSVIFGAQDKFLNLFAKLQKFFPVMPLAGAETKFQPVWVEDLAQAMANSLNHEVAPHNNVFEACGPEVMSLCELVQFSAIAAGINHGKGRPVVALPSSIAKLQAFMMGLLPGEPLISQDNLNSMKVDNVSSGQLPRLEFFGVTVHALSVIAPDYLRKNTSTK